MFEHILVPLDGSVLAEAALPHVVTLAKSFAGKVTLLRVLEYGTGAGKTIPVDPLQWHAYRTEAQVYLDHIKARLEASGITALTAVQEGEPADQIVRFIRANQVDLLFLSSHGEGGITGWSLGSVTQKAVMRAHIAVMIVRSYQRPDQPNKPISYGKILLPMDGSLRAECALPFATNIAKNLESEVVLTSVVTIPQLASRMPPSKREAKLLEEFRKLASDSAQDYLTELQKMLAIEGVKAKPLVLVGEHIEKTIHEVAQAEQIDLIILAAHGCSGMAKWPFGSTTHNVLTYGGVPVLVVQDLSAAEIELTQAEIASLESTGH